ncbi:MAG: DUF885 domain-containing protein [Bdellovibrionales bacterium]|nr:DUF885 domain-containing protein [Bdellovibrionales bacterium]
MKLIIFLSILFSYLFCTAAEVDKSNNDLNSMATILKQCQSLVSENNTPSANENEKFNKFLKIIWDQTMHAYPEFATYVGYPGQNDRWTDLSLDSIAKGKELTICQLKLIESIKKENLDSDSNLNYRLIKKSLERQIAGNLFPSEYLIINQLGGIHTDLVDLLQSTPSATYNDFQDKLKRIEKLPYVMTQYIALLKEGINLKITPIKFLMEKVPAQIDSLITVNSKENPVYTVMQDIPKSFSNKEKKIILSRTEELIKAVVVPQFRILRKFIKEKYIPNCRENISFESLPNGINWYKFYIEHHTTTNLSAQEIHKLGLAEVKRIDSEMTDIRKKVKFKGNKESFHLYLKNSEKFYYKSTKELIDGYKVIAKNIDPELPKQFLVLPRLTYGVRAMPDYKAPSAPTAYYQPGSVVTGRAGYFEANTYELKSRAKWEMEVLTAHEAVPGHHLQLSLAQEIPNFPEFRKHGEYTVFVEGWGLYAESLGEDLGLYKDVYSKYGQLTYEMWRAVRLVVDTGMHHMGWSKEKALKYFMDYIPKDRLQSEVEIDRYLTWPGQALAYKIGELKFKELKKLAQKKLGSKFDIREFHWELLRHGALPLDIVQEEISTWITKKLSE